LFSALCFSTEQIPDELNLIGATVEISDFPLESHPHKGEIVREIDSRACSASARGYKAEWTVFEEKLWLGMILKNLCSDDPELLDLDSFFETDSRTKAVFAEWYSGEISYQIGPAQRLTQDESELGGIKYEAVLYNIRKGRVLSRKIAIIKQVWDR